MRFGCGVWQILANFPIGEQRLLCQHLGMKTVFCHLALIFWIIGTSPALVGEESAAPPVFEASDTAAITAKDGQKVTVRGVVSTVRKSRGGTNFINFAGSEFYLVTFKSDLQAFENGEPADLFSGKHLAVTGVVSIYQGKPQMKLNRPDMVRIVDPDAPGEEPVEPTAPKKATEKKETAPISAKKEPAATKKKLPPVDPKKYFK